MHIFSTTSYFWQKYFLLCFETPKIWQSNTCVVFPISLKDEYIDFPMIASQSYCIHSNENFTDETQYSIVYTKVTSGLFKRQAMIK